MSNPSIAWLDNLPQPDAENALEGCCASRWWVERMTAARPFQTADALHHAADDAFDNMPQEAWREAFASHPQIGDLDSLKTRLAGNRQWCAGEQASVAHADEQVLRLLSEGNRAFYERFGFVFLVCATGKSAEEMLAILERRLTNDPTAELLEAAGEQRKITHLRLDKLITPTKQGETT